MQENLFHIDRYTKEKAIIAGFNSNARPGLEFY